MFRKKGNHKLDFLVVGTQKGGTTALDNYLRVHPEIGLPEIKELHFFNNEELFSKSKVNYDAYHKHFNFKSNKKVFGEVTPVYMYWIDSCKRIWEYNPNIKLIFILRNPIERAYSHWNMQYERNDENLDFSTAIKEESKRNKQTLPFQNKPFSYIDRGFYSEQIRRFKRFFDDDQMFFIKYDEFKSNQQQVLNSIFEFLNVNPDSYTFEFKNVHSRKKVTELNDTDHENLKAIFKNDIHEVERLLQWDCSDWLK